MRLIVCYYIVIISVFPLMAENPAVNDVDSLGDLWVFTLDKTGSMLRERIDPYRVNHITPSMIANSVMSRLKKEGGILDCIDYQKDKISIYETGYGETEQDSYGKNFDAAPSLDRSFIHLVQNPKAFRKNGKNGLQNVLQDLIDCSQGTRYCYRESFVSQIRVLTLSRVVDYIKSEKLNDSFRYIHLVIITDDADEHDQWKMDYYTIKFRSRKKFDELNRLNTKYIYSSFTQQGGGVLEENAFYTDISDARHIYLYDYITLQQRKDSCISDLIDIDPMDGNRISMRLREREYASDSISFAYIKSININGETIDVSQYMTDSLQIECKYTNSFFLNNISILGQIQVQYMDTIYGIHARKIDYIQHSDIMPMQTELVIKILLELLTIGFVLFLVYVLFVLPNKKVFVLITADGHRFSARRGYRRQWLKTVNPILFSFIKKSNRSVKTAFAKHPCYSIKQENADSQDSSYYWVIDSPYPLVTSSQLRTIDTSMDMMWSVQRDKHCPQLVKNLYAHWLLPKIDELTTSQNKWIRRLGRLLQRVYHRINPHYLYWIDVYSIEASVILTSPLLPDNPFLLEIAVRLTRDSRMGNQDENRLLYQYYSDINKTYADVLITVEQSFNQTTWNVFQLQSRLQFGSGISSVKHLMHYTHDYVKESELHAMEKRLRKAINKELHTKRVVFFHAKNDNMDNMPFLIDSNSFMSYVYLVDDTVAQKSHFVYSPLSDQLDATNPSKMVALQKAKYDMELFTSLLPFKNGKDMPMHGAAFRESAEKFPAGSAVQGELKIHDKCIEFLNKNIKTH